jgi:hypothetical protein
MGKYSKKKNNREILSKILKPRPKKFPRLFFRPNPNHLKRFHMRGFTNLNISLDTGTYQATCTRHVRFGNCTSAAAAEAEAMQHQLTCNGTVDAVPC